MSAFARGLLSGLAGAVAVAAPLGWWLSSEDEARVIIAAADIPEGTAITLSMLDDTWVPARFASARNLDAASVAGVMGHPAPQALRARDFVDPTHFGSAEDLCVLDARATAARLQVDPARLDAFLAALATAQVPVE